MFMIGTIHILFLTQAFGFVKESVPIRRFPLYSSNADIFSTTGDTKVAETSSGSTASSRLYQPEKFKDEAARLRREAAELEVSLREEARAKGLPEEMINKLIPVTTRPKSSNRKDSAESSSTAAATDSKAYSESSGAPKKTIERSPVSIRSKLGYLPVGDALRMTIDLDRLKGKEVLSLWNSEALSGASYQASNSQLKAKTNIDPIQLKLDDVGYNYQNVFVAAIVTGTVLALSSSQIGGELGFVFGYLSALLPIALVGLGSIAPALIGEIILKVSIALNSDLRERYVKLQAGKFLVGYLLGLPVSRFDSGSFSNTAEFYQIRPTSSDVNKDSKAKRMFSRQGVKQEDVAKASVVCLAGAVSECISYGSSTGTNAADVNTLYELLSAVEPALKPERIQDHIRWGAITAYELLSKNKAAYSAAIKAFEEKLPLEECIAAIEAEIVDESASSSM